VCSALHEAGATVVAVEYSQQSLAPLTAVLPDVATDVADLTNPAAVAHLAARVHERNGSIDGLIHLVGGYRGGAEFTSNTEDDWRLLSSLLIDTLRHVTLAFHDDIAASPAGRAVIVSAQSAQLPTAGSANYAAAKAAAEAWMLALADSLRRLQSGRKKDPVPQTSAATILVVKGLVNDRMRAAEPDRRFPGFTDVGVLASRVAGLWSEDAAALNGVRLPLAG
jgi:NAD(P)-dependent dehydrogenase (short-subunit alcohol dehydrogenase family)